MRINEMRRHFEKRGYTEYADLIESQAQRCARFQTVPQDDRDLPIGSSKLGGSPDLPPGTSWPSKGDLSLDFLAQINLKNLNRYPFCRILPSQGQLYFFYDAVDQPRGLDPNDRSRWQIVYYPGTEDALERRMFPDLEFSRALFESCRVEFYEALSPGWDGVPVDVLGLHDFEIDEYTAFVEELSTGKAHQVLGRPGHMETFEYLLQLDCQFLSNGLSTGDDGRPINEIRAKELEPGAADWRLLLQLDSDKNAGMTWHLSGLLNFWIREQDLRSRDFAKVWVLTQVL